MSNPIQVVRQGGSLPFVFDRGDESIDGWICTINVKIFKNDSSQITRVITPVDDKWTGFLTSTETDALSLGMYRLIGVLTDSTTNEEEQVVIRFNLVQRWA